MSTDTARRKDTFQQSFFLYFFMAHALLAPIGAGIVILHTNSVLPASWMIAAAFIGFFGWYHHFDFRWKP